MQQCNANDIKQIGVSTDPRDLIDIKGEGDITVTKTFAPNKTIYTIKYQPYQAPAIIINTAIHKVGTTVPSFVFSGQIVQGTAEILSRTITPSRPVNLELPFSWTESNIQGPTAGIWPRFNGSPIQIAITDVTGNIITKEVGLDFRNLFYMGYSIDDTINEATIKGFAQQHLLKGIRDRYSSFTYNYSIVPAYIYWVFPAGTPTFTEAAEGPLPVPLKLDHPNVNITDEGITLPYRVIRTAVKTRFNNATIVLR